PRARVNVALPLDERAHGIAETRAAELEVLRLDKHVDPVATAAVSEPGVQVELVLIECMCGRIASGGRAPADGPLPGAADRYGPVRTDGGAEGGAFARPADAQRNDLGAVGQYPVARRAAEVRVRVVARVEFGPCDELRFAGALEPADRVEIAADDPARFLGDRSRGDGFEFAARVLVLAQPEVRARELGARLQEIGPHDQHAFERKHGTPRATAVERREPEQVVE